jgi:hypothetical protein
VQCDVGPKSLLRNPCAEQDLAIDLSAGAPARELIGADVGTLQQTFLGGSGGALMVSATVAAISVAAALVCGDERRPLPARAPASDRA